MATLRDVARAAGVSIGTASRVLAANPATSPESRAAVFDAVAQLGYTPNARARSLRSARTHVLGLSISDLRNPFFAELAHAAEQEALHAGYVTMLANANEDEAQEERYLKAFSAEQVDGILLAPQGALSSELRRLVEMNFPLVFVDRTLGGVDVPSVTADHYAGMRQALAHLADRGHVRVGYAGGPVSISTGRDRLAAFRALRGEFGLDEDPELEFLGNYQSSSGSAALAYLLASSAAPTALITGDSPMALGAIRVAMRSGLQLGVDLELVTFDEVEWMSVFTPGITAIAHDADAMGSIAMRMLVECIEGGHPTSVVLPTRLVQRGDQ